MTFNVIQIIIGIILIIIAIKLIKKITKTMFFILMIAGAYSFAHGLINFGDLMQWWTSIF